MINASELRNVLDYDPATGDFVWLPQDGKRAFNTRYAGKKAGHLSSGGYIIISLNDTLHKAHRLAWLYVHGEWPEDQIDHRNLNRSDNRISNLRPATRSQNAANRADVHSASGVKGVTYHRPTDKWKVRIGVQGHMHYLGLFENLEDAKAAYFSAAEKHFGEFARAA